MGDPNWKMGLAESLEDQVRWIIGEQISRDYWTISPNDRLPDLDTDEEQVTEVWLSITEHFGLMIPDEEWHRVATVADVVACVSARRNASPPLAHS